MREFGIDIRPLYEPLGFYYGEDIIGPIPEIRTLEAIRESLLERAAQGPEKLYCIAMDVHRKCDRHLLDRYNLLFGVVTYNKGQIGNEPIRSQGHIHAISKSCQASTCEVYEIWEGEAYIYMQPSGSDDAGRCYAVHAKAGDVVVVPPGWVHATINANVDAHMTFGAWCVKDYGFDYKEVREHNGIAFFPTVKDGKITWVFNDKYKSGNLEIKAARAYPEFNIEEGKPIYQQWLEDPERFLFVSQPALAKKVWEDMKYEY